MGHAPGAGAWDPEDEPEEDEPEEEELDEDELDEVELDEVEPDDDELDEEELDEEELDEEELDEEELDEEELDEEESDEEEVDDDEPDDDELDEDELDDEPEEDELDEDEPDEDEPEDDDPALPPLGDEVSVPVASLSLPPQPSRLTEVANDTPRKTRRLRKKSPVCPAPAKSNASSLETNHITNLPNSLESPDCRPANRLPAPVRRALYPSDIAWADCLQA